MAFTDVKESGERRIVVSEMRFLRHVDGVRLLHKQKARHMRKILNIFELNKRKEYIRNSRVERM
jgi:hypothetical protein